jgi:hypothetical protein
MPLRLQAREADARCFAKADQHLPQPQQSLGRDRPVAPALRLQDGGYRLDRAARAERLVPVTAREAGDGLLQLGRAGHDGALEGGAIDLAIAEEAQRRVDAADLEGFGIFCNVTPADDHLGRSATDVDHQPPLRRRRQRVRTAFEDETRLLAARDDVDRVAERRLGLEQELIDIARLP